MTLHSDVDELGHQPTENKLGAFLNAQDRSDAAFNEYLDFFEMPSHKGKILKVLNIVENMFSTNNGIYVNYRANKGKPFTAVKADKVRWPVKKTKQQIEDEYYTPLRTLNVEIKYVKATGSYIHRIY